MAHGSKKVQGQTAASGESFAIGDCQYSPKAAQDSMW
jgi:hypothetical protein